MPKGAVILPSYHEAIRDLPDSDRLKMYDCLVRYGLYGELIELPAHLKGYFALIKPTMDAARNRYDAACANGNKGGRPRKNQIENQTGNQTQNQDIDKDSDNDSDSDTDTDSDTEEECEKEGLGEGNAIACERIQSDTAEYEEASEREKEERFERQRQSALEKLNQYGEA